MTHALDGCRLKIARANEHLETLEALVAEYFASKPYSVRRQDYAHGTKRVYRFAVKRNPPQEWSVILGDCLHNFRAALDHLAWQIVSIHGTTTRHTEFPIYARRAAYRSGVKTKVGNVGRKGIKAALEELQPYKRSKVPQMNALWLLQKLDVIDKHREHLPIGLIQGVVESVSPPDRRTRYNIDVSRERDGGAIVVRIEFVEPLGEVEVDIEPMTLVGIGEVPYTKETRGDTGETFLAILVSTLRRIRDEVDFAVSRLERFCD